MYSQAYRVRIARFDEEYRAGIRGFWLVFRCTNKDAFFDAVAAVKQLPLVYRAYDPSDKSWWVAASMLNELARDITDLEMYRPRWTQVSGGRRQSAPPPPPAQPTIPADVAGAFALLYLAPTAPKEIISAVHRVLARLNHPDTGGNTETMKAINLAAEKAEKWAEKQKAA